VKAVVLGGGIAGLTAGIRLAEAGASTTIVEAAPRPGGLASGFRSDGYTFDFFSHRLWTRDPEVLALVNRWTDHKLITRHKVSRILLDQRLYNYPIDLRDLLSGRSGMMALRALIGYISAQLKTSPRDGDFRSYLISRFGEPLFNVFFGPYTEKLYGCRSSDISMDLALGAIPKAGIFRQLVYRMARRVDSWDEFLYPESGFMELPEGMARAFERAGGNLWLQHRVSGVQLEEDWIIGVDADGPSGPVELDADLVVSTVPLPALLDALTATPPETVSRASRALRTRAMVAVYLGIRRTQLSADHWIYVPDPRVLFNRISETSNYSRAMAPPGRTGICAEIACDRGDSTWCLDDRGVLDRVIGDLVRIELLPSAGDVEVSWVKRFGGAYPVYGVDYKQHLSSILEYLSGIANLRVCGRQGSFWYGSTGQGIRRALDIVDGLGLSSSYAA
jgi:protoporphyrinogen oxidase